MIRKRKEKIRAKYFFMRTPYMKFQKTGMHGSKVMLGTFSRYLAYVVKMLKFSKRHN